MNFNYKSIVFAMPKNYFVNIFIYNYLTIILRCAAPFESMEIINLQILWCSAPFNISKLLCAAPFESMRTLIYKYYGALHLWYLQGLLFAGCLGLWILWIYRYLQRRLFAGCLGLWIFWIYPKAAEPHDICRNIFEK